MADNNPIVTPPPANDVNRTLYTSFADLLDQYFEGIQSVLSADGEMEQKAVVGAMRLSANTQAKALAETFHEIFDRQDNEGRVVLNKYIDATGAMTLIANTRSLMNDPANNQRSLLSWISLILEILKEIIVMLADLLHLPKSVVHIILAILEILEKIVKLISQFLGSRAAEIADSSDRIFWTSLERYWNTTAAWNKN
jgi:hypothetical protein